ncbi:MAG: AAA family ATPase [Bryobacterales bacterium]|nr:AAA family ATPase [Bryobacterales bacterium]
MERNNLISRLDNVAQIVQTSINQGRSRVTREEIESTLLTTGTIDTDHAGEDSIVLDGRQGRQLAEIIFRRLRSSTVQNLSKNQGFFKVLEEAFLESDSDYEPSTDDTNVTGNEMSVADTRSWRLKKIETRGFGGLNARTDDVFEFDISSRDFCIEGQNGSGKSSLANAVLFAMTGKVHRDQYESWDDPTRLEPVMSGTGTQLATWPPIATYPEGWNGQNQNVDVSVTLTFGNETDDEEIQARRRLHGRPSSLEHDVSIDPRLTTVPTLIETGLLMPMRIQHIRVPNNDHNGQLVGLIRQLIGLEPLFDVANLVDKLSHGNQLFRKYARQNRSQEKATNISKLLREAKEKIDDQDIDIDLSLKVQNQKPITNNWLARLDEARREFDHRQSNGLEELKTLSFTGFDSRVSKDRHRVVEAINQLHLDARRQLQGNHLPPVLRDISALSKQAKKGEFVAFKSALRKASQDLDAAIKWAARQRKDTLLRLKAVAAEHFEDCEDPKCPLCKQPIRESIHLGLVEDMRILKAHAEIAQTQLDDACLRIDREIRSAAVSLLPSELVQVQRFAVKRNTQDHVRRAFVQAEHVAVTLPGFAQICRRAIDGAFEEVEEFEFGTTLPEPESGDSVARIRRFLNHLESIVSAIENWQQFRQDFRNSWRCLFSKSNERSLTTQIAGLKRVVEEVEPFGSASEQVGRALKIASRYNEIVRRQALREEIVKALRPLRKLRTLVNRTTHRTINELSNMAGQIQDQIYNPEALTYEETEVSEFRGKQSLTFHARISRDLDWRIDASLLANVSWMRGILWSFVFAIRERAIRHAGYCPFELIVLDDPQMTFDTRNLKGWVQFLGSAEQLRQRQPCQLLVTTHSMPFALEMTAMPDIQMAEIESGQPWSNPAQVVTDDFAAGRYDKMIAENSDDRARLLIADVRILAETLLKHAIEQWDPSFVRSPEATLGRIMDRIKQRNNSGQPPYTDHVFGDLVSVKSSNPDLFRLLNESHHSLSETMTVSAAKQIYKFWRETLFPAVRKVWVEYRFLQKSVIGETAAISLPADCTHRPHRSTVLASARPSILGLVSAYSDGRAATAIRIDHQIDDEAVDLSARAAYRLEKDTLSPVAREGDILLTRLDAKCRSPNLVVEDRGTHRVARRWLEDAAAPALAILVASSSNPREIPPAVISRAKGANRRKIVGVLFAADRLRPGKMLDSDNEVTELRTDDPLIDQLVADTDVFKVQGSSAEPMALENQYLLAKAQRIDMGQALRELEGKPVIAEDSEDCAFFKRLRVRDSRSVVLESLDKTGLEAAIFLSIGSQGSGPSMVRVREVVGVIFDKE